MTAAELADLIADCLDTPELGCATENEPARPARFYVYVDGSIHRVDVTTIAQHPARQEPTNA